MTLQKTIERRRAEVVSERYSMSLGELAGLYERDELNIHPKFQRILRWSDQQKTRLIESVLLRIPIPPIFVAQDADGKWDVVDGVQRLGSIFEFLGILRDANGDKKSPLVLAPTHLLPDLDGVAFRSEDVQQSQLSEAQRLDFKRSRLDIQIILKESDPSTKYELFERLNTGGSAASQQEVRNCVLVWTNETMYDWMLELTAEQHFSNAVSLSDRLEGQEFHTELLLRLIVFYAIDESELKLMRDVGEFLNQKNRELATSPQFSMASTGEIVRDTMAIIDTAMGSDAFRRYNAKDGKHTGGFLISAFEAVAFGIAHHIGFWRGFEGDRQQELFVRIHSMWEDPKFIEHIGTGVAARPRLQRTIPFGREHFGP